MSDCVRGCSHRGQHVTDCLCTHDCPEHEPHCEGCLPRHADLGSFCVPCADRFEANLHRIPGLAGQLAAITDGKLRTPTRKGDRVTGTATPPSPSPTYDELDDVCTWAWGWALLIADLNHDRGPFVYTPAGIPITGHLSTNVRYLTNRFHQLCDIDTEAALYQETARWVRRLERVTGTDDLIHRLKDPCPSCGQRTLVRRNGQDSVQCRNRVCLRVWCEDHYAHLAHVAAS